ncbi:MAG: response regulator [Hyphomicrobiales bacterium]|jgi:two-component system chemotaxis response regulator CheY|nr:response regulator [Hyphomicrobiales bacterium]
MSILDQLKILIVDDTSTSRMLIRDGLEQLGIKNIVHAADGEQALKMMMSTPAHLVISDFNMPKLDGLQLLQAIRSYKPTANVPFIMLTSKSDTSILARGRALGLNNYLCKPVDMVTLKKAIEGVVGRLR